MTFAEFYADYPRKIARKDAEKAWKQLKVTEVIASQIRATLNKRKREDWRGRDLKFIPYPAHFLRSEGFDEEVEAAMDDPMPMNHVHGMEHVHVCQLCDEDKSHEWVCEDELCTLGSRVACPVIRGRYQSK